jgi:hypothetical protein
LQDSIESGNRTLFVILKLNALLILQQKENKKLLPHKFSIFLTAPIQIEGNQSSHNDHRVIRQERIQRKLPEYEITEIGELETTFQIFTITVNKGRNYREVS